MFFSFIVQNVKKDWKKRLACIILQPMSDTPEPLRMLLIVPCYNEEANIPLFVESAEQNLKEYDWQVLFVNDGSRDGSWDAITAAHERNPRVKGLCFARNFGHQNALKAGMEEAWKDHHADVYVTLDADLQHPIEFIPQMVQAWRAGARVVQAQREDAGRKISFFKKFTSRAFYGIFSWLSGVKMQPGMSDFRLIDHGVLEFVVSCRDKDFFLRGLLPWSGLKTEILPYTPKERQHGVSKFTLKKMCALALSGIVGYSVRPLYISIVLGMVSICLAMAYFLYVLVVTCCGITTISLGWPSLIATVLAIGGVQLFILGILGIYMGKLYMENKERPTYVIGDKTK